MLSRLMLGSLKSVRFTAPSMMKTPKPFQTTPLALPPTFTPLKIPSRGMTEYIPPTQYDARPEAYRMFYIPSMLQSHWETAPIIFITVVAVTFVIVNILWAIQNKVDVVFDGTYATHSISRTMDLCNPSVHKIITINQEYKPYPEMKYVLEKMDKAEQRARRRKASCHARVIRD